MIGGGSLRFSRMRGRSRLIIFSIGRSLVWRWSLGWGGGRWERALGHGERGGKSKWMSHGIRKYWRGVKMGVGSINWSRSMGRGGWSLLLYRFLRGGSNRNNINNINNINININNNTDNTDTNRKAFSGGVKTRLAGGTLSEGSRDLEGGPSKRSSVDMVGIGGFLAS